MTQILDLLSGKKGTPKKADLETPLALDRLSAMLTSTPAEEESDVGTEPAFEPAPDDFVASQPDESVLQADDSASQADDGGGVSSLFLANETEAADTHAADAGVEDPMETLAAVREAEVAVEVEVADTADDGGEGPTETLAAVSEAVVADAPTADDGGGDPMATLAAVSAIEDAVRDAQQRAETQLTALVERVQKAEAEHAAELARLNGASEQRVEQALTEAGAATKAEVDSLRDELDRASH